MEFKKIRSCVALTAIYISLSACVSNPNVPISNAADGNAIAGALVSSAVKGAANGGAVNSTGLLTSANQAGGAPSAAQVTAALAKIKVGKTTKQELVSTLGAPVKALPDNSGENNLWVYADQAGNPKYFVAHVNNAGVVNKTSRPKNAPAVFDSVQSTVQAPAAQQLPVAQNATQNAAGAIGTAVAGTLVNKALGGGAVTSGNVVAPAAPVAVPDNAGVAASGTSMLTDVLIKSVIR